MRPEEASIGAKENEGVRGDDVNEMRPQAMKRSGHGICRKFNVNTREGLKVVAANELCPEARRTCGHKKPTAHLKNLYLSSMNCDSSR